MPVTLGRYRLDSEIGRGSMGAVYLGRDPQLGRQVAIKTLALSREFAGDRLAEARQRFFREAETAGRLQHPDIVTIFDVGEAQDLAYLAMEYIQGEDLQRHTTPGWLLPVPQVLEIAARVAEALDWSLAGQEGGIGSRIEGARLRSARMLEASALGARARDAGGFDIGGHPTHQPKRDAEGRVDTGVE